MKNLWKIICLAIALCASPALAQVGGPYGPGPVPCGGVACTVNSLTATLSPPLSASAVTLSGAPQSGGSATTNFPLLYLNDGAAVTSFSTAGTEFGINAPSGFTGNFIDLHLNGASSAFSVNSTGAVSASGGLFSSGAGSIGWLTRAIMTSPADGQFKITNNAGSTTLFDFGVTTASVLTVNGGLKTSSAALNFPGLGTSSTGTTGTLCWTTTTGLINVDTTTTCLLSLEELKDIRGPISGAEALGDVLALKPFWGTWKKSTPEYAGDKAEQPFLGAHQVASVDKRLAAYAPNGDLHGVRYQELTAVLVAALKAEQAEIVTLKTENARLRAANDNFDKRLATLEHPKIIKAGFR
jgi:hypothetical protein